MSKNETDLESSKLLKLVQATAIAPDTAEGLVSNYRRRARKKYSSGCEREAAEIVADKIISRYAGLAAIAGGTTALSGVVPGVGTIVAASGGAMADAAACIKLQVDMVMCMADAYGYDLTEDDARHLSFLIAAGGTIQKAGVDGATRIATAAGVRMLRQYLRGAALQTTKQMFKKVGVVFTRKAVENALPFGVGVVIGSGANYGLTKFVGAQAKKWFILDAQM